MSAVADTRVREAAERDVAGIREIYKDTYGTDYTYPEFYDDVALKRLIFGDQTLLLVAEDVASGEILGSAAVVLEIGAFSDLVGEFGRLAVRPSARARGIGSLLMKERIARVRDRLQVGLIEARVTHPFSLKISQGHGFAPVGFIPMKLRFGERRESTAILVQYFGAALDLRRNRPRVVPEAYSLCERAMGNVGLVPDAVADATAAPYPHGGRYSIQELTADGYTSLLRIERGRVRKREVFGPMRLHYGFFRIRSESSSYLLARGDHGSIAGAVGFTLDDFENHARVFELIWLEQPAIRILLEEMEARCRAAGMVTLEIDVAADAPRMQRTLLELGFQPAAYVPALAFHRVERLDVIKMVRLLRGLELGKTDFVSPTREIAELVTSAFHAAEAAASIGSAVGHVELFDGLTEEQCQRLAATFRRREFARGDTIFAAGGPCREMFVVLRGEAEIWIDGETAPVGSVGPGECLGESALLIGARGHSATAVARRKIEAAALTAERLDTLVRRRPDIGVALYRNLARGLGEKLGRADRRAMSLR